MAGFFSDDFRERIRAASDIVDVIGGYVPLKRAGANFTALCPFHKEKSPSFNVNPGKQIFHCFGCHKGGDVFRFVMDYENIGFVDAITRLAERAKIPLEYVRGAPDQHTRHEKDQLLQIHEQITKRWQSALANEASGQLARDYLAKRGVSADAIKLFRLGAAPDSWDDTVNWAKSKDFELPLVEKAGLILKREGSDGYYDRFRGRLMFPICDEQGRVIAFSGRVLSGDEKTAKYVNSPETPIFTKGKVLFALDKAKRSILDIGYAIVCEGQLDTIMCHSHGVPNVVAPQGTALTAAHARVLRRYTEEIVLCFDGDLAGQRASARAFDDLLTAGIPFGVATIPPPDDPDSFIRKHGREAFVDLIKKSGDYYDFYLDFLCSQHDIQTNSGRQKVAELMKDAVLKSPNSIHRDKYAQKLANRLAVSADAVRSEFKKPSSQAKTQSAAQVEESYESAAQVITRPNTQEFWLLKLALSSEEAAAAVAGKIQAEWIAHPQVREIVLRRLELLETGGWRGFAAFLAEFDSPGTASLLSEAVSDERPLPDPVRQALDVALRLRNQFIERRVAALTQQASQPGLAEEDLHRLLHEQMALRELKRQPI